MKKPDPQIGQIVKFDYLWRDEKRRGRIEGGKDRPCAVVLSRRLTSDGGYIVLLTAITHSQPNPVQNAIEIPSQSKAATGLDDSRSWLILSEVNYASWTDAGIVPAKKGQWLFDFLPRGIAIRAAQYVEDRLREHKIQFVDRT